MLLSGYTGSANPTIPVCQETTSGYFQGTLAGGVYDGFMSKIYIDECLLSNSGNALLATGGLSLSPNPANGSILVSFDPSNQFAPDRILIYDNLGKTVFDERWAGKEAVMDMDIYRLPAGLFHLVLSGKGQTARAKFVKQ